MEDYVGGHMESESILDLVPPQAMSMYSYYIDFHLKLLSYNPGQGPIDQEFTWIQITWKIAHTSLALPSGMGLFQESCCANMWEIPNSLDCCQYTHLRTG